MAADLPDSQISKSNPRLGAGFEGRSDSDRLEKTSDTLSVANVSDGFDSSKIMAAQQKRALDSAVLAKAGTVGNLELVNDPASKAGPIESGKKGVPQSTLSSEEQLKQVKEQVGHKLEGVSDLDRAIKSSVEVANALAATRDPQDRQKIFSAAAEQFIHDNPDAPPASFRIPLNDALKHTTQANALHVRVDGGVGALQDLDPKASTEKNPSAIIGTAFVGTGNKTEDVMAKAIYTAEQNAAKTVVEAKKGLNPQQASDFDQSFKDIMSSIEDAGGFALPKDSSPRTKKSDTPSVDEVAAGLKKEFRPGNSGEPTPQTLKHAAEFGSQLAFASPAKEMQDIFAKFRQDSPNLKPFNSTVC